MRILLCLLPLFACPARAQSYGTELLALTGGGIFDPIVLYSLDAAGQSTTIEVFAVSRRPHSLALHTDNHDLVFDSTNPFSVVRFDPATGQQVATLHAGSPLRDVLAVRPWHTGDYLVADGLSQSAVRVVRADGSGPTTLWTQADRVNAVGQDLLTGQVLAGLSSTSGPCLVRLDPDSGIVTPLDAAPRVVLSLAQDHRDGAIYYGTGDESVMRWHPATGVSTFVPGGSLGGSAAHSLAFDRAAGDGVLVVGSAQRVTRLDFAPGGQPVVVAVHADLPAAPVSARDLDFRGGRNVVSRRSGSGNRWEFELSFAGEAGRGYVLALGASGFAPGVPLGSRTIPLVFDALAAATAGGALPQLQGNRGVLDAAGRATATLDLSALPPFAGMPLWAAAATLDAAAPFGVGTISKPIVVVLE